MIWIWGLEGAVSDLSPARTRIKSQATKSNHQLRHCSQTKTMKTVNRLFFAIGRSPKISNPPHSPPAAAGPGPCARATWRSGDRRGAASCSPATAGLGTSAKSSKRRQMRQGNKLEEGGTNQHHFWSIQNNPKFCLATTMSFPKSKVQKTQKTRQGQGARRGGESRRPWLKCGRKFAGMDDWGA